MPALCSQAYGVSQEKDLPTPQIRTNVTFQLRLSHSVRVSIEAKFVSLNSLEVSGCWLIEAESQWPGWRGQKAGSQTYRHYKTLHCPARAGGVQNYAGNTTRNTTMLKFLLKVYWSTHVCKRTNDSPVIELLLNMDNSQLLDKVLKFCEFKQCWRFSWKICITSADLPRSLFGSDPSAPLKIPFKLHQPNFPLSEPFHKS